MLVSTPIPQSVSSAKILNMWQIEICLDAGAKYWLLQASWRFFGVLFGLLLCNFAILQKKACIGEK
jgi:hypothetical protein